MGEEVFNDVGRFLDLVAGRELSELLYRLSADQPAAKVAELYNLLMWSADERVVLDAEKLQEWFYTRERRRIEIACQLDLFPSNSMDESERVVGELREKMPDLEYLLGPLLKEIKKQLKEEQAWADYRRETFEMPKEMTPGILRIIQGIKEIRN